MITKKQFIKMVDMFMIHTALLEKSLALCNVLAFPEEHGIDKREAQDMNDVISYHHQLYNKLSGRLEETLAEILTGKEDIQKEYLGFSVAFDCDKESMVKLLDPLFHDLLVFTGPALKCSSADKVKVFLNTLKKEFEVCD